MGDREHLSPVDAIGDLGIWIDLSMKFSMQCNKVTNKAKQALEEKIKHINHQSSVLNST